MVSKELYQSTKDWVNANRKGRSAVFITLDASKDRPIISACLDGNRDHLIASLVLAMEQDSTIRNIVEMALQVLNENVDMCNSK